jgi:hypothetical protein
VREKRKEVRWATGNFGGNVRKLEEQVRKMPEWSGNVWFNLYRGPGECRKEAARE